METAKVDRKRHRQCTYLCCHISKIASVLGTPTHRYSHQMSPDVAYHNLCNLTWHRLSELIFDMNRLSYCSYPLSHDIDSYAYMLMYFTCLSIVHMLIWWCMLLPIIWFHIWDMSLMLGSLSTAIKLTSLIWFRFSCQTQGCFEDARRRDPTMHDNGLTWSSELAIWISLTLLVF